MYANMNSTNAVLIRLLFVIASCLLTTSEAHFSSRGFGVRVEKRQQLQSQLISQVKRHNTKKEEKTMTARKMETLKYVIILYRFTSSSR
jgi:hypothetical protein